ncbi:hypothetical protein O2N63_16570 [Aliiroseovarius sp. KMU-50]|uniref:Apolipoprotein acyltransferase n=1 Tax=Aliiroseovarius salicola TaxID=3009082 RepID=A0ABT4W5A5_9RHOB|nr:hypothetical protein [Aliiroseovarius sp. KMU-50]MDA5095707.1 hypothetical protein [Aliiroseovarius sp. KMU-50]
MIVIAALLAGAIFGAWRAKSKGGRGFDVAQYAAIYGLIFALIAVFVTVIITR